LKHSCYTLSCLWEFDDSHKCSITKQKIDVYHQFLGNIVTCSVIAVHSHTIHKLPDTAWYVPRSDENVCFGCGQ